MSVKESRGRLSYLTPDRTKPITARKLGDDFDRAAVLATLAQNAARAAEQTAAIEEHQDRAKSPLQAGKSLKSTPKQDDLQRLIDIQKKLSEGKGRGYEQWAKIHNLKQAAKTLSVYQEYGFSSPEELDAALTAAYGRYKNVCLTKAELDELKAEFPADYEDYIERLSRYMASSGKHYQNNAATIRYWITKDRGKNGKQRKGGIPDYSYKEGESL